MKDITKTSLLVLAVGAIPFVVNDDNCPPGSATELIPILEYVPAEYWSCQFSLKPTRIYRGRSRIPSKALSS